MKKSILTLASVLLLVISANAQKAEFEEYDLNNGLHLILHQDDSAPVIAIEVMYDVSSIDEEDDKTDMGFSSSRGQKKKITAEEISKAKAEGGIFKDLAQAAEEFLRIEPLEGKNAIVLKYKDSEIYYDMTSSLKVKEVKTVKKPDGKEVKTPMVYSDYKEVNGVKFPHAIGIKSGPMNLDFVVQEIKVNEDVSDADFK